MSKDPSQNGPPNQPEEEQAPPVVVANLTERRNLLYLGLAFLAAAIVLYLTKLPERNFGMSVVAAALMGAFLSSFYFGFLFPLESKQQSMELHFAPVIIRFGGGAVIGIAAMGGILAWEAHRPLTQVRIEPHPSSWIALDENFNPLEITAYVKTGDGEEKPRTLARAEDLQWLKWENLETGFRPHAQSFELSRNKTRLLEIPIIFSPPQDKWVAIGKDFLPTALSLRAGSEAIPSSTQPFLRRKQVDWLDWKSLNVQYHPSTSSIEIKSGDNHLFQRRLDEVISPTLSMGNSNIGFPIKEQVYFSDLLDQWFDASYQEFAAEVSNREFFSLAVNPPNPFPNGYARQLVAKLANHTPDGWLGPELLRIANSHTGPFKTDWTSGSLHFGLADLINGGVSGIGGIHPDHPLFGKRVDLRLTRSPAPGQEASVITILLSSPIEKRLKPGVQLPKAYESLIHLNRSDIGLLTSKPIGKTTPVDFRLNEPLVRE